MSFLTVLATRVLDALDYEPPRCRVYLARPASQDYPYNVDCTSCSRSEISSINVKTGTVSMASTPGIGNENARKHLVERHGWRP